MPLTSLESSPRRRSESISAFLRRLPEPSTPPYARKSPGKLGSKCGALRNEQVAASTDSLPERLFVQGPGLCFPEEGNSLQCRGGRWNVR